MRLGILGAGMIVKDFLKITDQLSQYELSGICGTEAEHNTLEKLQYDYHIKNIYTDYDEMLSSDCEIIYIGVPNHLHYQFAKKAILQGKNVIIEKPIVINEIEFNDLYNLADQKHVYVFEAITNQYSPNYRKIKELLPKLGPIHIVNMNYSQYSSRFDSFKQGIILPAFDYTKAGGSLMDLNIYNLHFVVGIFGKPDDVMYYPNISKNIDTSGIAILKYPDFVCSCIASKDSRAQCTNLIQGENGYIIMNSPANVCESFEIHIKGEKPQIIDERKYSHRMIDEFIAFEKMITLKDNSSYSLFKEESRLVCSVQTELRKKTNIIFPGDLLAKGADSQ